MEESGSITVRSKKFVTPPERPNRLGVTNLLLSKSRRRGYFLGGKTAGK
jgi:hypothetical protein